MLSVIYVMCHLCLLLFMLSVFYADFHLCCGHYTECRCAECHYTECHYAGCRDATSTVFFEKAIFAQKMRINYVALKRERYYID